VKTLDVFEVTVVNHLLSLALKLEAWAVTVSQEVLDLLISLPLVLVHQGKETIKSFRLQLSHE
jgi:hypothetical protein